MYNIQNDIQVPFTTALLNQCHNPFKNNNVKKLMLCNGKESKHQNLVSGWSEEGVVDMQNSEFVTEPDQCKLNFENDTEKDRLQEMIENLNALNFIKYQTHSCPKKFWNCEKDVSEFELHRYIM